MKLTGLKNYCRVNDYNKRILSKRYSYCDLSNELIF